MVPSNWCMNWAQPTISGTMTEKRAGGEGEDIGLVMQDARPRRKPEGMPSKHGQRHFLARRRKGAVEVLEVVRRESEVVRRAVGADMCRLRRLRDGDDA